MHLATPSRRPQRRQGAAWILAATLAASGPFAARGQQGAADRAASVSSGVGARRIPETLNFANGLLRDRRYDLAAEEYERFLKEGPRGPETADAHFGLAEARLALGQYKEARRQYEEFLRLAPRHPNAPTAWYRVGETAYMLGDLAAARAALGTYTEGDPKHRYQDLAWTYLGDVCFALKDLPAARRAFEQALRSYPEGRLADRARYGLARTLAGQGETDRALTLFNTLVERGDRAWAEKAQYQIGEVRAAAGQYAEAVSAYEALEQAAPRSPLIPEARLHKAECLARLNRRDEAEALLRPLAANAPPHLAVRAAYALGASQWDRNQQAEALATWEDALGRFPGTPLTPMLLYRSAEALFQQGRTDEARARFLKLVEDYPKDPWADDALLRAARIALDRHEAAAAQALAAQFEAQFPGNPLRADARLIEGQAALMAGQPKEAIGLLKALLAEDRPSIETAQAARYYLGLAYRADGQADKSEQVLAELAKTPGGAAASGAQFQVGQSHFRAHRYAEAADALEKFLAARPTGAVVAHALAYLAVAHAELGHDAPSRAALNRLASEFPKSEPLTWAHLSLGKIALAGKQYDRAVELLRPVAEEAVAKYKVPALADLGWALLGDERPAEAAAAFAALLEAAPEDPLAPEAALARGRALERAGEADKALAAYHLVIEKYGQSDQAAPAALARARLLAKSERYAEAAAAFEQVAQDDSQAEGIQRDAVLAEWGAALLDAGKPEEADRIFGRLVEEFPDSPRAAEARVHLAESAYAAKDYAKVAHWLEPLVAEGSKGDPALIQAALFRLGRARFDEGKDWTAAAQLFDRLATEFPEGKLRAKARFWKAEAEFQAGDVAAAEAGFAAIIANPPTEAEDRAWVPTARLRLLQSQILAEHWREALTTADALKADQPDFPQMAEVDYARGRALQGLARFDEARDAYQKVIDARKGSDLAARAQLMRGETYFHQQNYPAALREFFKVDYFYHAPLRQAAALLEAGKVYERLGRWGDAAEVYEKLLGKFPDDPSATEATQRLEAAKKHRPASKDDSAPPS
ncbi:MAG: tetratricopeptide repeat protein [Isosphaeraceae bacterium]|nr:tetratricopeptide repeat protein [Isosphaeraceae bacterium]